MPILPVLFLLAACAPVEWPDPPGEKDFTTAVLIAAASVLVPVLLALLLSHYVAKSLYEFPAYHRRFARRYGMLRRLIHWLHLALAILAVVWGWGWFVTTYCVITLRGVTALAPLAELLVPAPFLLSVATTWLIHFDMMKAYHFAEASPVAAGPFWTRGGYFLFRLRRFAFLILMPVVAFAVYQSLLRFLPEIVKGDVFQIGTALLGVTLFLTLPRLAIPILGLQSLPAGPHRERLEAIAGRLEFRCGDLLVWPTHHTTANAMVLGVLPRLRYVIFTDLLLGKFDDEEIEAVLGHEIGHLKHGHLLYYAAFFLLSMMVVVGLTTGVVMHAGWVPDGEAAPAWMAFPPLIVFGGYLFVMFGLVSRKCERQADLYGVRTVAAGRADGHPLAAGVNAMTRALEKVALLNDMDTGRDSSATALGRFRARFRDWQHGSIADRVDFLQRLLYEPALAERFQRRMTYFRVLLIVGLLLAIAALGEWLGWQTLASLL